MIQVIPGDEGSINGSGNGQEDDHPPVHDRPEIETGFFWAAQEFQSSSNHPSGF
jgi:hypothetical protein